MKSAQRKKAADLPEFYLVAADMVPEPSEESVQRVDAVKAEVAQALQDLFCVVKRLMKARDLLDPPSESERENFDICEEDVSDELHRFRPGVDRFDWSETNFEALVLGRLNKVLDSKGDCPSGLLEVVEPIKKILDTSYFTARKDLRRKFEGMLEYEHVWPGRYRKLVETAAKGEWLKRVER